MKVALVHDYIKEYGGAERVLEVLHELYPDAPVFTTVYLPEFLGPHRDRFKNWNIRTSWFQNMPFKAKLISPLRLLAPLLFKQFDFSEFDVVIVSATGAYSPNIIQCHPERSEGSSKRSRGDSSPALPDQNDNRKKPIHFCYCHTPPRFLYGYETAREWKKNPLMNLFGTFINQILKKIDIKSSRQVDYFIANSREIAGRIKRFYGRESKVIYPPVDTKLMVNSSSFIVKKKTTMNHEQSTNYYLAGGRLARPKHIDLIVRTCVEHNLSLKVFGKDFAGYGDEILARCFRAVQNDSSRQSSNNNIQFLGEVSDSEKFELMKNAKAYIFASKDEDFGITPVEAMSVGTPVIAYRSGGVKESVIEGKTGVFFDELSIESLIKAIKQLNNITASNAAYAIISEECIKQAQKFSKERFKTEIREFINSKCHSEPAFGEAPFRMT